MINMTFWDQAMRHYNWAMYLYSNRQPGAAFSYIRLARGGFSKVAESDPVKKRRAEAMVAKCRGFLKKTG